ncbi:MAG: hypothetical protein ABWW70_06015 [Thermoproteota archaeon]
MSRVLARARPAIYLGVSLVLLALSLLFFVWSLGYLEKAMIATGLLSALIGFSLLSGGLYALRLSAYVYAVEKGEEGGGQG